MVLEDANTVFVPDAGLGKACVEQLISLDNLHLLPKGGNTCSGDAVCRVRKQVFTSGKILIRVLVDVHPLENCGIVH